MKRISVLVAAGVSSIAMAPALHAQDNDNADANADDNLIVITGTLIRGVEETGSQTISVDSEAIAQTGASTTNELLGTIPQVTNFFNNRFDNDTRFPDRQQITRPNLRNLPGINSATGSTTLVLVDGHRMNPMGVDQAAFDPDFIAPGSIERVEIVTDGGSSLYGADAVGGVINFITRKSFDGIQLDASYDVGSNYDAYNLGFTAGTNWNNGGAYISYAYFNRDGFLNEDRSYANQGIWDAAGTVLSSSGTQCLDPVGEVTTWFNFGAGWTNNPAAPGAGSVAVGSPCDIDAERSFIPDLERHSALFGLTHDFSDSISFELKANFGDSSTRYAAYPLGDTVSEASPNDRMIAGNPGDLFQTAAVGFSYGANAAYVDRDQTVDLRTYGITPELIVALDDNWEIRNTLFWGRSENSRVLPVGDRVKMLAYVDAGELDPANVGAATAAVIQDILNSEIAGETNQELFLARTILDGGLFELPGGTLRAAVGLEYNRDKAEFRGDTVTIGGLSSLPFAKSSRDVLSAFGELSIPVFSMLDLSVSGRYDDYSDFGSTFNPTIGASFEPFDGLRIFGHWGESFNAPTALDAVRTANARFIPGAVLGVPDPNGEVTSSPGVLIDPNRDDVLLVEGSGGGLQPQTAETWSVGVEFEPIDYLVFSANYYDIKFSNLLGAVNPQLASVVTLNPDKFIFNPSQAEYDAFLGTATNGAQFADIDANDVALIIDRRIANIGAARLKGIDFSANFWTEVGSSELSFGVAGNKQLDFVITENTITVDQLQFDVSDYNISANIGWAYNGLTTRLTANHTGGFDVDPNTGVNQDEVDSFTLFNLFVGYDFPEDSGYLDGLSVRFNVDNILGSEPPVFRSQRNLNYSGFTLGRIFKFSLTKRY